MLDYFSPKRLRSTKKNGKDKSQNVEPLLSTHDEKFLASIINKAGGTPAGKLESVKVEEDGEEEEKVIFEGEGAIVKEKELEKKKEEEGKENEDKKEQKKEGEEEKEGKEEEEEEEKGKGKKKDGDKDGSYDQLIQEIRTKWGQLSNISEDKFSQIQGQLKKFDSFSIKEKFSRSKKKGKGKTKEKAGDKNELKEEARKGEEAESSGEESHQSSDKEQPHPENPLEELSKEDLELQAILESLDLSASHGKIFSSSSKSDNLKSLLRQFTQILKDLANGVPTAYSDLLSFLEKSSSTLNTHFKTLPSFLQNVVQNQVPKSAMKTEFLRTLAATSPALAKVATPGGASALLGEIAAKPAIITELLKDAVAILKMRFPLLLGGSVAVSLGMFVVLFLLWYCWKRGKEEREAEEEARRLEMFGVERIPSEKEWKKMEKRSLSEEDKERLFREGETESGGYHSPRNTPAAPGTPKVEGKEGVTSPEAVPHRG